MDIVLAFLFGIGIGLAHGYDLYDGLYFSVITMTTIG